MRTNHESGFDRLRLAMEEYAPLSEDTWAAMVQFCSPLALSAGQPFLLQGDQANTFAFVVAGLLRMYRTDKTGRDYTKVFFPEKTFPGSMVSLLEGSPSHYAIDALEDSQLIGIDFAAYRELLGKAEDLKWFQIQYLEKNWLLAKEPRETALALEAAKARYLTFLDQYPTLSDRLNQYHIASYIGVTPTQLSRIRRSL